MSKFMPEHSRDLILVVEIGLADLGVVIRTLVTAGDGTWELGTGGGITVRSDADEEYAESRWKAERLLRVFD